MSVLNKTWRVKNTDPDASLLRKLLSNRGLKNDIEIDAFFNPQAERDFHDPFLMRDMQLAVERISRALENSERIMIFGDYDVDGITGSAILMRTLRKLGGNVSYRLPHRTEDGYGMREKFVREFRKLEVAVIITVDNGISCFKEITLARELGIDVIITDHHTVPEKIPPAFAILHPKLPSADYPFTELTGAGVALKLAQALLMKRMNDPEMRAQYLASLLDLACMGTITDFGELRGENRYIVKEGLKILENTRWPGLSRLKQSAGVEGKIDTYTIGFLLGPRINAAGRISHASHALRLLLHDSENTEVLAQTLERLNRERQKLTGELMEIAEELAIPQEGDPCVIIFHAKFHGGVIGLLASKLVEKYAKPAIVMEDRGETLVGSCRSIPAVNIVEAIGTKKNLLTNFGGHAAAAGFEVPKANLQAFYAGLKEAIAARIGMSDCAPALEIDCEIAHDEVSAETFAMLGEFEPFGQGNSRPRFLCSDVPVQQYDTVGKDGKHLKIKTWLNGGPSIDCIGFGLGKYADQLKNKKTIELVCELEENTWNGRTSIQLKMVDFKC